MSWYEDYLMSDHWQRVKWEKLERQAFVCERCGYRGKRELGDEALGLNVHHLTYERRGAEELDDLEVLCGWCHQKEHGKMRQGTREQWEALVVDRALRMRHCDDEIDVEVMAWDRITETAGL